MLILACDHGGFELKEQLKDYLTGKGQKVEDMGALVYDAQDDFPLFAKPAIKKILADKKNKGILICGSGVGVNICCNRHIGIYAAVCRTAEEAAVARGHNDINVLNLGGRNTDFNTAKQIADAFLTTKCLGGKHTRRMKECDEV